MAESTILSANYRHNPPIFFRTKTKQKRAEINPLFKININIQLLLFY